MRSVTVRTADLKNIIINLGFVGENEHRQIRFDAKKDFEEYPHASASLTVVPPEGESYPAIIERDGDFVLWTITDSDVIGEGDGEIQLAFTEGEVVKRTCIGRTKTDRSLVPTGSIPSGIDDFITRAGAALTAIPETVDAALEEAKESGEFDGPPGEPGQDGYSPTATVSKSGSVATITITDKNGTTTAQISDGEGGGTGDYEELDNLPQIGGVTLKGNKTLHDLGAAAESDIPDPTSIIDDTAGSGDTNKVWSADKSHELLTEINSRYTKPNTGIPSSDMAEAVQTSLGKADSAYQKPQTGIPASDIESGVIPTVPAIATSAQIKTGTDSTHPIAPNLQNESVFYALAKLAGADMASSSNPVGQFTDDALVKIQKMLKVYQSPWELIREDTFTNDTEAEHEITVDGNGDSFELTDVIFLIETPKQNNEAVLGTYGRILFYYGVNYLRAQVGQWTQQSNASANGAWVKITDESGLIQIENSQASVTANGATLRGLYVAGFSGDNQSIQQISNFAVNKIKISSIKGTGHYKLYGRRKWN